MNYEPRLKSKYRSDIVKALQGKFQYKSSMQVPRLTKICLNSSLRLKTTYDIVLYIQRQNYIMVFWAKRIFGIQMTGLKS